MIAGLEAAPRIDGPDASAADRDRFPCLDGIRMTEPNHRLMAKQWLELLGGARGAALDSAAGGADGR